MERWSDPLWVIVSEDVSCRSSVDASIISGSSLSPSFRGPALSIGALPCDTSDDRGGRIGGRGGVVFSVGLLG
jgi:hypothetical protein